MEASQASEAGSIPVARSTAWPSAGRFCYAPRNVSDFSFDVTLEPADMRGCGSSPGTAHLRGGAMSEPICSNVARNLGTLTCCRYRENRRIPTMQFQILKYRQRNYVRHFRGTTASGHTGVEGAGGSGGHGRASRSTTPSDSKACGDLAGGRARRRPEHQRRHTQRHTSGRAAHTQRRTSIRATSNQAPRQPRNANARQPERAAARSRN